MNQSFKQKVQIWILDNILASLSEDIAERLLAKDSKIEKCRQLSQKYEDMLANRNAVCTQAQALFVTNHAIQRYKERIGYSGSDEDLRKKIYKLTVRHLATMDKLEDGTYDIEHNVRARVKDNTVCTIMSAPGKKKQFSTPTRNRLKSKT